MSENVIEVRDLVEKYGNFTAVNGISFNIGRGIGFQDYVRHSMVFMENAMSGGKRGQ